MKKTLLCLFLLCLGMGVQAQVNADTYTGEYTDGYEVVWYFNIAGGKADIVGWDSNSSTGDLMVPKTVYDGSNYYAVNTVSSSEMIDLPNSYIANFSIEAGSQAQLTAGLLNTNGFVQTIDLTNYAGTSIPTKAFYQCSLLQSITFPANLVTIEESALSGCSELKTIDLSGTKVETIGVKAFEGCYGVTSMSLPTTLKTLGTQAFSNCSQIPSIDLSQTQVTMIPSVCFQGCRSLTSVRFNNYLAIVDGGAFRDCLVLPELTFPASLTTLNDVAFGGSKALQRVIFEGKVPPTFSANSFTNAPASLFVGVPVDCAAAYKAKLDVGNVSFLGGKVSTAVREKLTISRYGFSSYFLANENFKVPAGVKAHVVTGSTRFADGKLHAVLETYNEGEILPKQNGCVLEGAASTTYWYEAALATGERALQNTNLMKGYGDGGGTYSGSNGTYYVLSPDPDGTGLIGFYYQNSTAGKSMTLSPHQAGLFLPTGAVALSKSFLYDRTTGIENATAGMPTAEDVYFDLQGRRVQQPAHGVYIVNGKKIMVK